MRKFFLGVTTVSMLAALLVGAALAWTTTAGNVTGTSQAGTINAQTVLTPVSPTVKVYPTGTFQHVQDASINNTTSQDPGIPLKITGGSISGFPTSVGGAYAQCDVTGKLSGQVVATDGSFVDAGASGGKAEVDVAMDPSTPNCAMSQTFGYTVNLNVSTQ